MKYFDADKLLAEIESRMEDCKLPNGKFQTTTNAVRYEELSCLRNFVTSLQQEQPSELGAEDEKIRKELWEYFRQLQLMSDREFSPSLSIDEILSWLKSPRQQPSWKPSKDEITAIEVAVKYLLAHTSDEQLRENVTSAFRHLKQLPQQENEIVELSFRGGTYRMNGEEHAFKG